jgi:hypothetical protein
VGELKIYLKDFMKPEEKREKYIENREKRKTKET